MSGQDFVDIHVMSVHLIALTLHFRTYTQMQLVAGGKNVIHKVSSAHNLYEQVLLTLILLLMYL